MPGPRPTPTETLAARGSWRAKARTGEPRDPVELPTCPDWLDAEAKREWRRLAPLLVARGTVSKIARGVLAGLCQSWSLWVWASKQLNDERRKEEPDQKAVRQLMATAAESYKVYLRSAQEFGITPASRAKVQSGDAKETTNRGTRLNIFDGQALG